VLGTGLFLHEEITWSLLVGGAVTLAGVALVNGWKKQQTAAPMPTE
jgi:drug/metabolite transporter (DMT)-like permease